MTRAPGPGGKVVDYRLVYHDADGREVTRDRWRQLACTTGYGLLARQRVGDVEVEASWLGVSTTRERAPRPFVVLCRDLSGRRDRGDPAPLVGRPVWCADRDEAMSEFRRSVELLGD